MKKRPKIVRKLLRNFWMTIFFSLTFAIFVVLGWSLLIDAIENKVLVFLIAGGVVVLGIVLGQFRLKSTIKKIVRA